MKKIATAFLLLATFTSLLYFYYFRTTEIPQSKTSPRLAGINAQPKKMTKSFVMDKSKISEVLQLKVVPQTLGAVGNGKEKVCDVSYDLDGTLSESSVIRWLSSNEEVQDTDACRKLLLSKTKFSHEEFKNLCIKDLKSERCMEAVSRFRSALIDQATEGQPIPELSTQTLVHKVFSLGISDKSEAGLRKKLALLNEIEERDSSLGFSKFKTLTLYELAKIDPSYQAELQTYIEQLYQEDPEEGLKMWYKKLNMDGDHERLQELVNSHIERFPDSSYGYYVQGLLAYKAKDLAKTKSFLNRAISLSPDNDYLQEQIESFSRSPSEWSAPYLSPTIIYSF